MNRLIQWFVENPIAANLLMVVIILGGLSNLASLNKEVFPGVETNLIRVDIPYPGAGPVEVEEQVVKRVEEAIADLEGIEEITSTARLSLGTVQAEAINGYDSQRLLNNIKARVDAISTFPADAEKPIITEALWQREIMSLGIYGDVSEAALKQASEKIRDEIALLPGISIVNIKATRPDEMAVEISEYNLRHYNLSFEQVVNAVRQASLNLPAGTIKSDTGDIQLQTRGQAYSASDFERIVVDSHEDGSQLTIGDVGTVTDGFAEDNIIARLNGKPAVFLEVKSTEKPDIINIAKTVNDYLVQANQELPAGIEITVWQDWSKLFEGRMNLLLKNSLSGLVLVFVILMLFLRPALAAWVCVGIAIAFLGALWLLPLFGVSLNMISMFAFLMVLGIVVDDAIIVGESIYSKQQSGLKGHAAAASGAKAISKPVFFAVVSTMIFFAPLLVIPGGMGDMSYAIPIVVILALAFSLLESLLILPSHLSHLKPEQPSTHAWSNRLSQTRGKFAHGLNAFAVNVYRPGLLKMLRNNGTTISLFLIAFGLSAALYGGGWMHRTFMPVVTSDFIRIQVSVPEGSPFSTQALILKQLEQGLEQLKTDPQLFNGDDHGLLGDMQSYAWQNQALVTVTLNPQDNQKVSSSDILNRWKELVGPINDAEQIQESATINAISEDITLRLTLGADDHERMLQAIHDVKTALSTYPGVYDLRDSLTEARSEIEIDLKPNAELLGLGLADIARQVRQGFYGEEAQRIPRGKEDVKVMVRYPKAERNDVDQLGEMRVRTADGRAIPLETVANIRFVPGYTQIDRIDRKRAIAITAEVAEGKGEPNEIVASLLKNNLPAWRQQYPGFDLTITGDMEDESQFLVSTTRNFGLAILVIYGLMAVAFGSYWQPVLILTAIPFGFMGAVIGHLIMGREVSMMSMLGFFACAGVVVNDNLVLLDRINQLRHQGMEVFAAVVQAGLDRFRPIILTSVTTFIGLVPIMAETSTQARFLIPMVISLSFGVLFATGVTLILVPSLYLLAERIKARLAGEKISRGPLEFEKT
ncbi:efflux RND transporter permease subunit [Aestuariicella hydrocarbonica]|uniref:Efflux RND transporter permease subunit n=1 Tax=Pseudomaricurvus hydrocarbonicus TaxID=1470433 RepID=A0A9E5JWK9_9GAMM|nr:efflux RND transporter permease subunit [Aestuariicella hydrocarbonica]NHO66619.1 efflux RND transporter permease subunit [Aestuariicella hydrocarbonica]